MVRAGGWTGRVIGVVVAGITACAGPAARTPRRGDGDGAWPMFRGQAAHGGDARGRGALAWRVAWTVELGARIDASPLVIGAGAGAGIVVATRSGVVVRLAPADGAEQARVALGGDVWATPAAVGGVIVVGVRGARGGELVGLEAQDLRIRWRRAVASGGFGAATVAHGLVWLCNGTAVVAVAPADGAERARWPLGDRCFGAPAITDDTLYVASRDGAVRAYALADGLLRWAAVTEPGADNDAAPVVAGDALLIASSGGHLHAFGRGDGAPRWRVGDGAWVVSAPAVGDGVAVVGDDGGVVRAIGLADGGARWRGVVGGDVASSPVLVDGGVDGALVVHGAHDGLIHAWRLGDGAARPPIDAGAAMFASPAVTADGAVVLATHAGRVLAIR